jgi:hypothetical protein
MLWSDTTSANFELKMYDGAQWIPVAVLDATNNVARVAVDSAETSYITSTTAGQIRHVIANTTVATMRSTGLQFNIAAPVISDSNANELFSFTTVASAVNHIDIANAATGVSPSLSTVGNDTNIDLVLSPKGTGVTRAITSSAATNTVIDAARIEARSTGTPATGIGTGLLFATETADGNFEIGARIEAITTDVTGGSEDFDLSFKVMAAGAAAVEVMRIRSTGVVDVDALSIANVTVTSTAAELNILDGVTSTAAELNILDGVTATTAEINYLDITTLGTSQASKVVTAAVDGSIKVADAVTTDADNDGTFTTGTYTPTPLGGNMKRIVNGGAFTLAAPSAAGDYTLVIQITNTTGAGAITLSGFSKTSGDLFTTTNGHDFFVYITKCNAFTLANVVALQ